MKLVLATSSSFREKLVGSLSDYMKECEKNSPQYTLTVQDWIQQVWENEIVDPRFRNWLRNQTEYYRPKDQEYAKYLEGLLGE